VYIAKSNNGVQSWQTGTVLDDLHSTAASVQPCDEFEGKLQEVRIVPELGEEEYFEAD
jgi:hypothetical protein